MRLLLDANVLLDCLILETNGLPRAGKAASDEVFEKCDHHIHQGLVAWHTLPIIDYYFRRQNSRSDTASMIDGLLVVLHVPTVGHLDAVSWRATGLDDYEDAPQVVSAISGNADIIITRNTADFANTPLRVMTPEEFLMAFP